jgi:hypothetical protein
MKKQRHSQFDIRANAIETVLPSGLALAPGTDSICLKFEKYDFNQSPIHSD